MAAPLKIRFATDTAGAKAGVQDLAASIVSNMVKISGTVANNAEAAGAAANRLGAAFGTGAQGVKAAATTIVTDLGTIGAAGLKAANDSKFSGVAIGAAMGKAAAESKTGAVAVQTAWAAASAGFSAKTAIIKNEAAAVGKILSNSPVAQTAVAAAGGFVALGVAILGVNALAKAAAEQVERLAEIGNDASSAGVSTGFLQSMRLQARDLKIDADEVLKTLERLKAASVVKLGEGGDDARNQSALEGRLRQQAKAGNISQADVNRFVVAPDTEAKFKTLLELMQRLIDGGRQLTALDIGSRFLDPGTVDRIRQDRTELEKLIEAANTLKTTEIFSRDEIARSQDLSKRLDDAQSKLSNGLKPIYEDLARLGYNFHASNVEWVEYLSSNVPKVIGLYKLLKDIISVTSLGSGVLTGPALAIRALTQDPAKATPPAVTGDPDVDRARTALARGLRSPTAREYQRRDGQAISDAVNPPKDNTIRTGATKAAPSTSESLDQVERLVQQMEKANDQAKAELEAVGKTNVEREKALGLAKLTAAAREAGRDATDEEVAKVTRLAEANAQLKDRTKDVEQAQRQAAEAMRTFGQMGADAFADMLLEGKSFEDTLKSLEKQLAKMLINAAFTGSGPLAGVLGLAAKTSDGPNASGGLLGAIQSALPNFRANGGPVSAGRAYTVGEMGREIFVPSSDGRVVPIGRGGAGGSGNVSLTVNNSSGSDVQPTFRQAQNGDLEMIVDVVTKRQARDAGRGRGEFARAGLVDQRLRG